jgi:hypothetical protein
MVTIMPFDGNAVEATITLEQRVEIEDALLSDNKESDYSSALRQFKSER